MSNSRTQRDSIDIESEMLPPDPPSWIVRWTAWLLLGVLFLAFVGAIVLKLPETVHCPFVLVPATGTDSIQSPHQGILSRVSAAEGEVVKKGAELFVLRADEIRGLDTQFRTLNEDLRTKEENLMQSDSAYKAQANITEAEIDQAKNEVRFRENYAKTSHDLVERMGKLAQEGSSSEIDLVRMKLDLAGSEKDLSVAQKTLQQVNLDRQRME
ncbi:MAG: hypothetical protein WA183_19970, partial [Chthoniobacterales bacterium]